jgi:putative membrane protein
MHPSADSEHVGIVVLAGELRSRQVVRERRANSTNLIGRDLLSVARTSDYHAHAARIGHNPKSGSDAVRRVVIAGDVFGRAAVHRLMARLGQMSDQQALQLKTGVVASQVNAHSWHRASYVREHNAGVVNPPIQPLLLLCAVLTLAWYLRQAKAVGRQAKALARSADSADQSWPIGHTAWFIAGLVLVLAATSGPVSADSHKLFWIWLSQALLLLLVLPIPIMAGQPVELAKCSRSAGGKAPILARLADSDVGRLCASPIVGAGLIPVACVAFLFGPVPGWTIHSAAVGWVVQLAMIAVGLVIVLPLISRDTTTSSLVFGAAIAIGLLELLLDAVPGLVMRLSTHPVTNFFEYRSAVAGQLRWLSDQQFAGGVLWCVAELLDLPFLLLIFHRWVQADAREAAEIDAAIETPGVGPDQPWFLSDPQLRDRFR